MGLLAGSLWNTRVGLFGFCAALAGASLGRFAFAEGGNNPSDAPSLPGTLNMKVATAPGVSVPNPAPAGALLEATMDGMREGVLVTDQTLRVVASNNTARAIFSRDETALEQNRLSALTRNPAIHSAFRAALERGERTEVKVELLDPERRVFDLRVVPLHLGDDERPRGTIGVFFDITQLERLERVRQEFLSNVSHELRTPLTAIIAFVETLEESAMDDPENNRRFLSVIRRNAARMHSLIDDILELSAIESGAVTIEPASVRLYPIVADVVAALAANADVRRVAVQNQVNADAVVFADARRLEQMLTNLIDNAIKFNREGGSVTITFERSARDRISITDTGSGIPSEHIGRIFERFYRVDRARSRELGGTGLGLAIVKHLARAHGGEATVRSIANAGSTFTIELPVSEKTLAGAA